MKSSNKVKMLHIIGRNTVMANEKLQKKLEQQFQKFVKKAKLDNTYLLVDSDKHGVHVKIANGETNGSPAHPDQPYYISNVDKMFISVLTAILEQEGKLSYEDTIDTYLEKELVQDLHIIKFINYSFGIKIKQLLNHTSGLYDFMEDKPQSGEPMINQLLKESSDTMTKLDVLNWSKNHLKPLFQPGKGFHYSNTGYLLLMLIIEKITERPIHELIQEYIFEPLEMNYSYVIHHTEPKVESEHPPANCYIESTNMNDPRKLGIDNINGRIVSTSADLLKFIKGLVNYKVLERDSLNKLADWADFPIGVDYGYGIMKLKDAPILNPKQYNAWGNAGLTGTFIFYHMELETYFIGSLNHYRSHQKAILLLQNLIDVFYKYMK